MKHVFSNDMVAHVWAQQTQEEGRTSNGNFSFRGPALYSYRTMIASFVLGTRKRRACLITSRSYSATTSSKHMPQARRAVHGVPVFYVPNVTTSQYIYPVVLTPKYRDLHKDNLRYLVNEYQTMVGRFRRMRDYHGEEATMANYLADIAQRAVNYADMFGLKRPSFNPDGDASTVWAYRLARIARTSTPEHAAKLVRSRERREERKAEEEERKRVANYSNNVDTFLRYMLHESSDYPPASYIFPEGDDVRRYLLLAEIARDKERSDAWYVEFNAWKSGTGPRPKEIGKGVSYISSEDLKLWQDARDAEKVLEKAGQIADWRSGRSSSTYMLYDVPTMLRVQGETIQTSRGAEFPLSHALRAIPLVLHCRERQTEWKRNGHTVHLGSFQIDTVETTGNVKAGCHYVTFEEIQRLIDTLCTCRGDEHACILHGGQMDV